MNPRSVGIVGLVFVTLNISQGRAHESVGEPQPVASTSARQLGILCTTNDKTDATERQILQTYTSPKLKKALLSSDLFWKFLTNPSTPYLDRMAAANRGGSLLSPGQLPSLWQAMAEVNSVFSGVSPPPCSAVAVIPHPTLDALRPDSNKSKKAPSPVVLGHPIELPNNIVNYPITAEERGHSPWLWQMERALSTLFDKTNIYYGDVRYPARVKAAWGWQISPSTCQPGDPVRNLDPAEWKRQWNKISIRSRALTERAPHDILLFQTILRLALDNDNYYVAYSAPVQDLWSWGPDHHLEELAQAAQILILRKTRWENVAALAAFQAASSARYEGDVMNAPHARLVKSATAIHAIGRWATDKSLNPWNRYYSFAQPICRIVNDAPCPLDQLRVPQDPRFSDALKNFDAWFENKRPELEREAEAEQSHFRSLTKELAIEIK